MHPIRDTLLCRVFPYQNNLRGFHSLRRFFPEDFDLLTQDTTHHISAVISNGDSVRPLPFSLAAIKGITNLFSFPAGTKMFQFPAYIIFSDLLCFLTLGNLQIKSRMQIPGAYRSLPRPSSQLKPSYPSNSNKAHVPVSYTHLTLPTICSVQISVVAVSLKKKKKKIKRRHG
eukprot:TRINITY_DN716_c0_g1_i5.p2 TRINITY_DN716_c0_g1~~TRINITY_DN716_c0_g1_i5.p2  ORF type:complete len:172 (-),score=7.53 TRINITY_DN716_c0_g1_i5:86-601(-)